MEFKDKLRRLRLQRGLTQEQLATALNVPESTIRRYEVMPGAPKRERLELFADYFNVSVDFLIGRHDVANEGTEQRVFNSSDETIRLIEEQANKMGLSPTDPIFKKMLSDAFDLLRIARQQKD